MKLLMTVTELVFQTSHRPGLFADAHCSIVYEGKDDEGQHWRLVEHVPYSEYEDRSNVVLAFWQEAHETVPRPGWTFTVTGFSARNKHAWASGRLDIGCGN